MSDYKNEWRLCLETYIITKLSQPVFLINTHILIYSHARCDHKLWTAKWFYYIFWVFSYIFDDHSYLNCCILQTFTKHVVRHTLWCINLPDVTAGYRTSLDFVSWVFLKKIDEYSCLKCFLFSPNFHKLCIKLIHTLWCVNMPDVTASYGSSSDLIAIFWIFNEIFSSKFR